MWSENPEKHRAVFQDKNTYLLSKMWFYVELQPSVPPDCHYPSSFLLSGQLASVKLITVCPNSLPVHDTWSTAAWHNPRTKAGCVNMVWGSTFTGLHTNIMKLWMSLHIFESPVVSKQQEKNCIWLLKAIILVLHPFSPNRKIIPARVSEQITFHWIRCSFSPLKPLSS